MSVPTRTSADANAAADINDLQGQITKNAPVGAVLMWATETPPNGWLECDGSEKSRTTYSALFAIIGEKYGNGDGSTTFNLPDCRGQFLRGWDHGAGNDPDAGTRTNRGDGVTGDHVGTKQLDTFQGHRHTWDCQMYGQPGAGGWQHSPDGAGYRYNPQGTSATGYSNVPGQGTPRTSAETRSKNINIVFIIKT
jgi:phage-related tail fiber protein